MAENNNQVPFKYEWFTMGDINGFFGLMFDNMTVLSFLAGILIFGFGFPAEIVYKKMFPGTAFGVLRPVMPNPIARHANFSFELYRTGHVTFSLYDVTGRRVARLVNATLPAGVHSVSWDGVSDGGVRLASGVYMYEVAMGADRLSRRMILVH